MKKLRKALSILLVGAITVTSLFCGAVISAAAGRIYGNGDITGKYVNDDTYSFVVHFGSASFTEADFQNAYKQITSYKSQAVADVMLASNGENCYGFLLLDYVYPMDNPYNKSNSGQTQKDRVTRRFIIPIEIPESKLEERLSLSAFTTPENFSDIFSSFNFKYSNSQDGSGLDVYLTGFSCTINLKNSLGSQFLNNIQGCDKWYFGTLVLKNRYLYSLTGDAPEFFEVSKSNIAKGGYKEPEEEDRSKINVTALKIGSVPDQTYTGNEITPDVTLSLNGDKTLKKDTDYTLTYKNNINIGKASVTINLIGSYSGSKTLTFSILPRSTPLIASKTNNKFKLVWNRTDGIDGYQIQYSTDGGYSFKSAGKFPASKKTCSLGLDTNKKTMFRIRTYVTIKGKTYYSKWSKTVTVKK